MEDFFEYIWALLRTHGAVPNEQQLARDEWKKYNLEQKRTIYRTIRDKIRNGKFVNYHPHLAIHDNAPKPPRIISITAEKYYEMYHTQKNCDGWVRTFLPNEQRTIYVKQIQI